MQSIQIIKPDDTTTIESYVDHKKIAIYLHKCNTDSTTGYILLKMEENHSIIISPTSETKLIDENTENICIIIEKEKKINLTLKYNKNENYWYVFSKDKGTSKDDIENLANNIESIIVQNRNETLFKTKRIELDGGLDSGLYFTS